MINVFIAKLHHLS